MSAKYNEVIYSFFVLKCPTSKDLELNILSEKEFRDTVEKYFSQNGVCYRKVDNNDRKDSRLNSELFFDLARTHHKHVPDMMIYEDNSYLPCELKSPKEFYDVCRFSHAHLCSYLLQIIYGQCFSYADLFRPNDILSICLIIPKMVTAEIHSFKDIERFYKDVLNTDWAIYHKLMGIEAPEFSPPTFSQTVIEQKYGIINCDIDILATKITYTFGRESGQANYL